MPKMPWSPINPFGPITVTTPGTLVNLLAGAPTLVGSASQWPARVSKVRFEALPTNAGLVYIGVSTLVRATLVGVIARIPPPADPILSVTYHEWNDERGANRFALQNYWLDADVATDGVLLSVLYF